MDKKELVPVGFVLLMFFVAASVQDTVPDKMATHWNAKGQANGWGGKFIGLYLMPLVTLFVLGLFYVIPRIEVLEFRANIIDFEKHFLGLKIVLTGFLTCLYLVTVAINLGYNVPMNYFMIPALSGLFYYIGYILQFIKRNFWIGIRTPWAIANDNVWNKTHTLGSRMFRWMGVIMLAGLAAPEKSIGLILVLTLGGTFYLLAYSYVVYRREVEKH
ncbi:DUF1648 domain-containing protein [Patescibacteria group bacterium]|nr:DUF1648 domain-containing protein [Patescibacteria group bacterium]